MVSSRKETWLQVLFAGCAALCILSVALICWFLFANGLPAIVEIGPLNFLGSAHWTPSQGHYGILAMIVGSICLGLGSALFGVPLGVLTAVYLAYYCPKKLYEPLKSAIDLLAGIPSVVFGFFGLVVLVGWMQKVFVGSSGKGILCASLLLAIMILPTIVSVSENALQKIDPSFYEASRALGAGHDHTVFFVCLPAAARGIGTAAILGISRAIGETMAVIMVAGNAAILPASILSPVRTLTTGIVLEMSYASGLHRQALIAMGAILFVLILIMNIGFFKARHRNG